MNLLNNTHNHSHELTDTEVRLRTALDSIRNMHHVQGSDGNWNTGDYMLGLFNGLECALAVLENREHEFRNKPSTGWPNDVTPNLNN